MDSFRHLHQPTGRIIHQAGADYLFFGGTSYLGLPTNPDYIELFKEGVDKYGVNNGTSRSNNVQLGIYDLAEENMASRFGFEDALLLSSGYLAAQLTVHQLRGLGDLFHAPGAHPALWLDNQVPYVTEDFDTWAKCCVDTINRSEKHRFVVISNTLDNLKPQGFDFSPFKKVAPDKKVYLLLDDSHGIGIATANRCFVDSTVLNTPQVEVVVVASLAKGMATDAGVILCRAETGKLLRQSPFFRGASPPAPAALYALMEGETLYKGALRQLHRHIAYMGKHVNKQVNFLPNFAVFTVAEQEAFARLLEQHILISSFAYPLPRDPLLNRIVLSAHHRQEDLERLLAGLSFLE